MRSLGRRTFLVSALVAGLGLAQTTARGEEIPKEYQETVKKGLTWMAKSQFKDGHFEGINGQYFFTQLADAQTVLAVNLVAAQSLPRRLFVLRVSPRGQA